MALAEALLPSAARTATMTSRDIFNPGFKFLDVVLDVTSAGTGSVTVTINYKDVASGKYILLLSGAAVTTISTNAYQVGPYMTSTANVKAARGLPDVLQIVLTANNGNTLTSSLGYVLG